MHAASPSRKAIPERRFRAHWAGLAACFVLLTGCPRRFDSRADPIPASTDPAVEHEYREARARLEAGDLADAAERYAAFVAHHPDDALARSAKLGEARARLSMNQAPQAKILLEPLVNGAPATASADPLVARARYLLGAALVRGGDPQRGRELLRAFRGVPMTSDDEVELHALFAAAALALGDSVEALVELERFYEGARPAERLYITTQAAQAAQALSATDVETLWRGDRKAMLTAFVGMRAADARRQMGDTNGAQRIEEEANAAREKLGLVDKKGGGVSAPRSLQQTVGCVLPLSGKLKSLGERALRGALLGAELVGAGGQGALALEVRDTGSDPARARAEVEALAQAGVLAIVGPPDRAESIEVAAAMAASRVPTLAIGSDDGRGAPSWFRLARPRTDAARAAAKILAAEKVTRVAILGPDGTAGKELARVFAEEARARKLTIVAEVRFPEAATTFVREVKQLADARPQAIFLPTTAAQLDLIAPQLATAGVAAMANLKSSGREARLIATADGLSARSLVRSGKYLQGAIVLPPFWADAADPRAQAFLERYHEAYNEEPSLLDALGFDAVRSVRLVVSLRGEPRGWDEVSAGLREIDAGGLTGTLGFSTDGNRTGEPAAWIVDGNTLRPRGK